MKTMKIIQPFPVSTGKICFMSALADILNYYNYGVRESDLFGLCEGNLFYFGGLKGANEEELVDVNLLRVLKMGGMKYEIMQMVSVLQEVLGLAVEGFEVNSTTDIKELVKSYIDREIPLLALVLRYYLEYSVGYQKDTFSHTVTVHGYDFEQELVYITDTFEATKPVSNYQGALSLANFRKSFDLSQAVFEMVTQERILAIYPTKGCTLETVPVSTLNQTLVHMAENNLAGQKIQGDILTGVSAMAQLIHEFAEWREMYSPELFQKLLQTLHNFITNYGGPYVTLELLAEYVKAIYARTNERIYQEIGDMFLEIRRLWLILGNMCFKASLGKIDGVCERITERLKVLASEEERVYTKIVDQCKGLGMS